MRVLHTSDWHLGHRLFARDRVYEHLAFLDWLLGVLREREVDALLIAGDIFDSANPPALALSIWYSFLAECARSCPGLLVCVIGGNHDAASRLDAPKDLLAALDVCVVGGAREKGRPRDFASMCVPLRARGGHKIEAWVAAVPFLRPVDLPRLELEDSQDPLIEGVAQIYREVFEKLRAQGSQDARYLAMGHLYLRDGQLSQRSERKVLGGNQHAIPAQIFPDWLDYVALGHLHRAQKVGRPSIRYSGSVIPMSMDERHYAHQVLLVSWQGSKDPVQVQSLRIPRALPFYRIPEQGHAPVCIVLEQLTTLSLPEPSVTEPGVLMTRFEGGRLHHQRHPFLELAVKLHEPDPDLRARLAQACTEKGLPLTSLSVEVAGRNMGLAQQMAQQELGELLPEDVLAIFYEQRYDTPIPADLVELFSELQDGVEQSRGDA